MLVLYIKVASECSISRILVVVAAQVKSVAKSLETPSLS